MYGIPCPACGSTRALCELLHGNIGGSILLNPIGILLFFILLILPFWIIWDVFSRKTTLYNFWQKMENTFSKKWALILLFILFLSNWIWNIYKDL
jgi:hypothetical protein